MNDNVLSVIQIKSHNIGYVPNQIICLFHQHAHQRSLNLSELLNPECLAQ